MSEVQLRLLFWGGCGFVASVMMLMLIANNLIDYRLPRCIKLSDLLWCALLSLAGPIFLTGVLLLILSFGMSRVVDRFKDIVIWESKE